MIVKREKIYKKFKPNWRDTVKCTSWWLFGIIPIFINHQIIEHARA